MNKTIIGIVAAISIALFGGWYAFSPAYALSQLRDAAIEGDQAELEERVDFDAVRTSMKEQMKAQVAVELMKEQDENPLAAMGGMMAMGVMDTMIDSMVTPEMIVGIVKEGSLAQESMANDNDDEAQSSEESNVDWDIERDGLSSFTVHITNKGEPDARMPSIMFDRDGLGWRLVDIRFPAPTSDDAV